jgi:putative ABC transport system ATP-binding protein
LIKPQKQTAAVIEFKNVTREYTAGGRAFRAADGASFSVNAGELAVILGPSGAGKSTVLNLLGGMDRATSGEIFVNGQNLTEMSDDRLTEYRAEHVGFVFQFYNLIPTLTALENVALTRKIAKNPIDAREALALVGLAEHADKFPAQLSGGEQQRVSIARAAAKNPALLLCDEPTGALDSETGALVFAMLRDMNSARGATVVVVTHNEAFAEVADRVIRIKNGRITDVSVNPAPKDAREAAL